MGPLIYFPFLLLFLVMYLPPYLLLQKKNIMLSYKSLESKDYPLYPQRKFKLHTKYKKLVLSERETNIFVSDLILFHLEHFLFHKFNSNPVL